MVKIYNAHKIRETIIIIESKYNNSEDFYLAMRSVNPECDREIFQNESLLYVISNPSTKQNLNIHDLTKNITPEEAKNKEFQNKLETILADTK